MSFKKKRNNLFLVLKKPSTINDNHYQKSEITLQQTKENEMKIKKFLDFSKKYFKHPTLKPKDLLNLNGVNLLNLLNIIFPTPLNRIVETALPEQQIKKNLKELKRVLKETINWSKYENFSIKRLIQKKQNEEAKFLNCLLSLQHKIETFGINKDQKQIVRDFYVLQGELKYILTNEGVVNYSSEASSQMRSPKAVKKKEISLSWNKSKSENKNESEKEKEKEKQKEINSDSDNWDLITSEDEDNSFNEIENNKQLNQESNKQIYKNIFFERHFQYILPQNNKRHLNIKKNKKGSKVEDEKKKGHKNDKNNHSTSSEWEEYQIPKEFKEISKDIDFLTYDGFLEFSNLNLEKIKKKNKQNIFTSSSENYLIDNLINLEDSESEFIIDDFELEKQQRKNLKNTEREEEIENLDVPKKMVKKKSVLRTLMKNIKNKIGSSNSKEKGNSNNINSNTNGYVDNCLDTNVNVNVNDSDNDFNDGNSIMKENNNNTIETEIEQEIEHGIELKSLNSMNNEITKSNNNINNDIIDMEYFKKKWGFFFIGKTENHLQLTREFFSIVANYLLENSSKGDHEDGDENGGKNEKKKEGMGKGKGKKKKKKRKKNEGKKTTKGKRKISNQNKIALNKIEFFYLINTYSNWSNMKLYEIKDPIKQIVENQSKIYLKAYNEAIQRCRIQATEFSLYCSLTRKEFNLMKIHLKYNSFTITELNKINPIFEADFNENSFFIGLNYLHSKVIIFSKTGNNHNIFVKLKSRYQKLVIVFLFLIYRSTIQKNKYVGNNPNDFSKKNVDDLNTKILPQPLPIDPELSKYFTNPLNIFSKFQNTNKNYFNNKIIEIISKIWKDGGTKFQVFFLVNKTVPFEPGILYIKKRGILEILQNQIINNHQFSKNFKLTQTQKENQRNLIKINSNNDNNKPYTFFATNSSEEALFISKTILFFNKQYLNNIKK
ncbi:hypothetical protein M0812_11399 [Anaeramoeba flamelloides]|uniref:Uncharacterized protein n=1 Tax=Anaeramoeba flamelloides TaxID=1746091 RepID=A0AAV7ZY35_9EUKA|nr:hypothetical protein M0812_11399 [Anaeramoeba flamelloides]